MRLIIVLLFFSFIAFGQEDTLTFRDIYDFQIGDEFHRRYYSSSDDVISISRQYILDRIDDELVNTVSYQYRYERYVSGDWIE